MRHGAVLWRSCPGTSRPLPHRRGARPPWRDDLCAPLGSASWAGTPPVGVGVARSIRSAISPWRSARSLVRGTHLLSSIARAMSRSTDDSERSCVVVDLPPVFYIENRRLCDMPRQQHATIKSRHIIRHFFSVFERVSMAGKVTVSQLGSRQPSAEEHGRVCRLLLGVDGA